MLCWTSFTQRGLYIGLLTAAVCRPLFAETPAATPASGPQFTSPIAAEDVRPHIEHLASPELRGRSGPDALRAAEYIRDRFVEWGVKPLFAGDSFFQQIPGKPDDEGQATVMGTNVGGWIPGSDPALRDEFIIIGAHHDHLGVRNGRMYRGADDNASGVSMMLETARQIAAAPVKPRRSLVFVGFDLEERLLWGSRWFVSQPPWPLEQVKLFVCADMIGRSLGGLPLPTVFVLGCEHAPGLKEIMDEVGTPHGLEAARLGTDLIGVRSDYGPFRVEKVPFLFFSTGEHSDYHTPRDVPERIDYEKVAAVSGLVLTLCTRVADADETPAWTDDVRSDLDEAATLNRIATLLLEADQDRELSGVQRMLVSHAQTRTKQILDRGQMTEADRKWLIRIAQVMLLSVF